MSELELVNIKGGMISASYLNSIARIFDNLYNLGRSLGRSLRMMFSKC